MLVKKTLEEYLTPRLLKGLRHYIGKRVFSQDREDLLQRTLLRACRYFESYNPKYAFSTWVYRIAYRETMRHVRDETRHASILPLISLDYPVRLRSGSLVRLERASRDPQAAYNARLDVEKLGLDWGSYA